MIANWGDEGEIDLLEWFGELTLYTSSSCLIGRKFRESLNKRISEILPRPRARYRPYAHVDYNADIESFRRRDAARAELVEFIGGILEEREANPETRQGPARPPRRSRLVEERGRDADVQR